jgi:hypothetical protein
VPTPLTKEATNAAGTFPRRAGRGLSVFFLLLFLLPLTSHAATITFYDMRSDWETAVGGVFEEEDSLTTG